MSSPLGRSSSGKWEPVRWETGDPPEDITAGQSRQNPKKSPARQARGWGLFEGHSRAFERSAATSVRKRVEVAAFPRPRGLGRRLRVRHRVTGDGGTEEPLPPTGVERRPVSRLRSLRAAAGDAVVGEPSHEDVDVRAALVASCAKGEVSTFPTPAATPFTCNGYASAMRQCRDPNPQ